MPRRRTNVIAACLTLLLVAMHLTSARAEWVADFEDLAPSRPYAGPGGGFFENGKNLSGSFVTGQTTFYNSFTIDSGWETWSGWAYSNTTDTVTRGYTNQYSAYVLSGSGEPNNYGVGFPAATVDLPGAPVGFHITNTTYAALSMLKGDGFAKKFGGDSGLDPDFFLLTITGTDLQGGGTGQVQFYLADYRAADTQDDYIVQNWTWVDLAGLDETTRQLHFRLSSTDNGSWGMNTPGYFALDNLTTVPEPGSATLGALALLTSLFVLGRRYCRRPRQV